MKIICILLITLVSLFLVSCNSGSERELQKKWNELIRANNNQTEIKRIEELSYKIMKLDGYFSFYGIKSNNDTLNLTNYKYDSIKFKHINIEVYWGDNLFYGQGWVPVNRENMYLFFRE